MVALQFLESKISETRASLYPHSSLLVLRTPGPHLLLGVGQEETSLDALPLDDLPSRRWIRSI